jgi:hypothetical protein
MWVQKEFDNKESSLMSISKSVSHNLAPVQGKFSPQISWEMQSLFPCRQRRQLVKLHYKFISSSRHGHTLGWYQSQKAWKIGRSVQCGNCNPLSVLMYLQATLKKERKPLQHIIMYLTSTACKYLPSTSQLTYLMCVFVKPNNTAPIHSFLVRVQWMVSVLSGHHETYFISFHLKFDIFNFSLKLHSMTNNGSILSRQ